MLQVIFGDDEHTAAEGAYTRVMKTRKWLYLSSGSLIVIQSGLYDEKAASDLIKIIKAPIATVSPALCYVTIYLLVIYCLLAYQLISTYDLILTDRFTERRADEIRAAEGRVVDAQQKLRTAEESAVANQETAIENQRQYLARNLSLAEEAIELYSTSFDEMLKRDAPSDQMRKEQFNLSRQKAIRADAILKLKNFNEALPRGVDISFDPAVSSQATVLADAQKALYAMIRAIPHERRGYKSSEKAIDFVRIILPFLFGAATVSRYFGWW